MFDRDFLRQTSRPARRPPPPPLEHRPTSSFAFTPLAALHLRICASLCDINCFLLVMSLHGVTLLFPTHRVDPQQWQLLPCFCPPIPPLYSLSIHTSSLFGSEFAALWSYCTEVMVSSQRFLSIPCGTIAVAAFGLSYRFSRRVCPRKEHQVGLVQTGALDFRPK